MNTTTAAATRPQWYDDKLIAYMPFARKCARKLAGSDDIEEVMQDAYADALNRWAMYDQAYSFGTFISQLVRNSVQNRKAYRMKKKRSGGSLSLDDRQDAGMKKNWLSVAATQDDHAELSCVLRHLSGTRDSEALMRRAMGEDFVEIGADMGICRERARQLVERERAKLRKLTGMECAA